MKKLLTGVLMGGVLFASEVPDFTAMKKVEQGVILRGNPLFGIVPGLHHTYMNDVAYEHFKKYIGDYRAGKNPPPFPKGSQVVFVNFKDKEGKQVRIILEMLKTNDPGDVGGWKWRGFLMPSKKQIVKNPEKDCANCHYKGGKDWDGLFVPHAK